MGRNYPRNNILLTKTKLCKTTCRNGKNAFVIDRVNYNSFKKMILRCCPNENFAKYQWESDPLYKDPYLLLIFERINTEKILV